MPADLILSAASIITMDPAHPRVEAVALDSVAGTIVAVGTAAELTAAYPSASVTRLAQSTLLPGFIDAHSHPVMAGMLCKPPAHWIAPYVGYPTYSDVTALFEKLDAETPSGHPLLFNGLDRTLQGAPELTAPDLDAFFPDRPVFVLDNSGHEGYFNTALITKLGWANGIPPADPVGARFGRSPDGRSDGRAYELTAVMAAAAPLMAEVLTDPLASIAGWYRDMAAAGITATSEHTFSLQLQPAITALASVADSPLRLSLYHVSTEDQAGDPLGLAAPSAMVSKVGVKLWADGSPWTGTMAASVPYLDNAVVRGAGIAPGAAGPAMLNYSRAEIDALLARFAPQKWQISVHVNGDIGLDLVLDAMEQALTDHALLGTDHGWRVEHLGAARADQFSRAAALGVSISLSPFQFIYWGDLLDGTLVDSAVGSQWQRFADAVDSGASVSFHNDGFVSPPLPLRNIQAAITRRSLSGALHGAEQRIGLDAAIAAHTTEAARQLRRGDQIGSITPGKLADFVELSADPYAVDPERLEAEVEVLSTWLGARRIDLDAFQAQAAAIDPAAHRDLHTAVRTRHGCLGPRASRWPPRPGRRRNRCPSSRARASARRK